VVYFATYVSDIEQMRQSEDVDMVQREMELRLGLRVLKFLLQLRTFNRPRNTTSDLEGKAHRLFGKIRTVALFMSPKMYGKPPDDQDAPEAAEEIKAGSARRPSSPGGAEGDPTNLYSDTARVAEWQELFDLMDMPPSKTDKVTREGFNTTFRAALEKLLTAERVPPKDSVSGSGGDGSLSVFEFGFFLVNQQTLTEYYLPPAAYETPPTGPIDEEGETYKALVAMYGLYAAIKTAAGCTPDDIEAFNAGLSFDEFFVVMLGDEMQMESEWTEVEIAEEIFELMDSDGGGAGELDRQELKNAFVGIPSFEERSVDDFVYMFKLNSEGNVEKEEFVTVVDKLDVVSHKGGF